VAISEPSYWFDNPPFFEERVCSAVLLRPRPPLRPLVPLVAPPERLPEVALVEPPPLRAAEDPRELLVAEDPPVRPPPLEVSPPFFATAVFVRSLADASPLLEVPFDALLAEDFDVVLRDEDLEAPAPEDFDAPPLVDLDAALEPPRVDLDAVFDAPRADDLDAVFEPPRAEDLDAVFEAPRAEDLDAPPREDLDAALEPPRTDLDAPPLADLDALFERPREAVLLAARPEDLLAALLLPFDAPLDFEALFDFDAPFDEPPRPEDEPPRPEDDPPLDELPRPDDFDAPFLEAAFDEELRPELLLADFLEAAFLVDFAMLMVFRVSVYIDFVLKLQQCKLFAKIILRYLRLLKKLNVQTSSRFNKHCSQYCLNSSLFSYICASIFCEMKNSEREANPRPTQLSYSTSAFEELLIKHSWQT
jgi:hypothetical protein